MRRIAVIVANPRVGLRHAQQELLVADCGQPQLLLIRTQFRQVIDLRVLDPREPGALQETLDRASRRADARTLAFLAASRLRLRQADDMKREYRASCASLFGRFSITNNSYS